MIKVKKKSSEKVEFLVIRFVSVDGKLLSYFICGCEPLHPRSIAKGQENGGKLGRFYSGLRIWY